VYSRVVRIKKNVEYHQTYFILSFIIFEIIPFFTLSILNLNLALLVKLYNDELHKLRNEPSDKELSRSLSINQAPRVSIKRLLNQDTFSKNKDKDVLPMRRLQQPLPPKRIDNLEISSNKPMYSKEMTDESESTSEMIKSIHLSIKKLF
jgi:hypothetical protein